MSPDTVTYVQATFDQTTLVHILFLSCMSLIDSNDFINCAKFWKFPTILPSSATTQLNSISTQTKAEVSFIPTFPGHPPMTVVSMEGSKLKTLSRLHQDYFKTIFRLIQSNWASTQFPLKPWAWHYSAPACYQNNFVVNATQIQNVCVWFRDIGGTKPSSL